MNPENPQEPGATPAAAAPATGLPPVTPPSGRFIVQLFLVPGLIVAVAVLVLLAFRYLFGGAHAPDYFLGQLKSDNADIRWRAASDLAQVINRPENVSLRCDVKFALDLNDLLREALDDLWKSEEEHAQRIAKLSPKEQERSWRKLGPKADYVDYLAGVIASFPTAVGVPLLSKMAEYKGSPDIKGNTIRRRKAVWNLATLGNQCKEFAKLEPVYRQAIREALTQEAEADTNEHKEGSTQAEKERLRRRALWARHGLHYLRDDATPRGDKGAAAVKPATEIVRVDEVLARCAKDPDRDLRARVAVALNFWDDDPELVERTLLDLAHDHGFGQLRWTKETD